MAPKNHHALSSAINNLLRNKDESLSRATNAYNLALSYTLESGVRNLIAKIRITLSNLRLIMLLLWVPFLLEASGIPFLTISIPGSPLSLGRICLTVIGITGLNYNDKQLSPSPFRWVIYLLIIGTLAGTIFLRI